MQWKEESLRSNQAHQISNDSYMQELQIQTENHFFLSLSALFVFYSVHSSMQQPSLSHQPVVETIHPYIMLSGWALSGLST